MKRKKKMKNYDFLMQNVVNDFVGDYDLNALFEELFGEDYNIGELVVDMFNSGLIPNDRMEAFVNE